MSDIHSCSYHCNRTECIKAQRDELRERLAQSEQEPVAWLDGPHLVVRLDMRNRLNYQGPWVDLGRAIPDKWTPFLYTAPPQRTWVGLDHQDKKKFSSWLDHKTDDEVFTAIDDLLREMNT
jgi:hypothetical protein